MPARSTRQEARARILAAFTGQLDRVIPEDEGIPLKGATFADFEDQAETLAQTTLPVVLEERAALEPNAEVQTAGRCPHCGSQGVYLEKEATQSPDRRIHYGFAGLRTIIVPRANDTCTSTSSAVLILAKMKYVPGASAGTCQRKLSRIPSVPASRLARICSSGSLPSKFPV